MFFNKKGGFEEIKNIILVLIVAVVLFLFIPQILEGGERGSDIVSCRNWAVLQSAVKDPVVGIKLANLNNPCVTFKNELKGNKFDAYETLANGMHDTWKMYGQGKVDFFSNLNFGKKETYCFIGDEISINKKKLKIGEINIDEFEEYLSNTFVPKSEQTYAEFFTGVKNTKIDFGIDKINLTKNDKIYVLFTIKKGRGFLNLEEDFKSIGVGCLAGVIAGVFTGPGILATSGYGCVIGFTTSQLVRAPDLYPGLILISGEDINSLKNKCNSKLHYKPKEGIFKK